MFVASGRSAVAVHDERRVPAGAVCPCSRAVEERVRGDPARRRKLDRLRHREVAGVDNRLAAPPNYRSLTAAERDGDDDGALRRRAGDHDDTVAVRLHRRHARVGRVDLGHLAVGDHAKARAAVSRPRADEAAVGEEREPRQAEHPCGAGELGVACATSGDTSPAR